MQFASEIFVRQYIQPIYLWILNQLCLRKERAIKTFDIRLFNNVFNIDFRVNRNELLIEFVANSIFRNDLTISWKKRLYASCIHKRIENFIAWISRLSRFTLILFVIKRRSVDMKAKFVTFAIRIMWTNWCVCFFAADRLQFLHSIQLSESYLLTYKRNYISKLNYSEPLSLGDSVQKRNFNGNSEEKHTHTPKNVSKKCLFSVSWASKSSSTRIHTCPSHCSGSRKSNKTIGLNNFNECKW